MRNVHHVLLEPCSHQREKILPWIGSALNRVPACLIDYSDVLVVKNGHRVQSFFGIVEVHRDVVGIFVPDEQLFEVEPLSDEQLVARL